MGFVVRSDVAEAWQAAAIAAVRDAGNTVRIHVTAAERDVGRQVGPVAVGMLRAYDLIDERLFGRSDDPRGTIDIAAIQAAASARPEIDTVGADPHVVIRFDRRVGPVDRWAAPPFGEWSLDHGVGLAEAARPEVLGMAPGGPEMLLGIPITISQLTASSGPSRHVIGQVVSRVDRLSLRRGSRGHVRKVADLVVRTVAAVRSDRALPDTVIPSGAGRPTVQGHRLGSWGIARAFTRILAGYFTRMLQRKLAPERWVVAVSRDQPDPRGHDGSFRFLDAPDGVEWADPFPVRTPHGDLLFVEEYVRAKHRGRLAVVRLDGSPRGWASVTTILDLPTHLSYPFVFEWAGSWYLLPEQASSGGLDLYVADDFPTRWRWHSTLLEQAVADATIAEIDGRWWMFATTNVEGGTSADELRLFHAASPLGPWSPHPRNPVVSDVRSARSAGRVIHRDGTPYRVAQDGSLSYGHSISIVRVDRIDLDGYRETTVDLIGPDWAPGLKATHTINSDGGLTAIDALRNEPPQIGRRRAT